MKIISITDTREMILVDDGCGDTKMVPVPGTGIKRACDICGKTHEIHVEVATGNGRTIVGLGCAKKNPKMHAALLLSEIETLVSKSGVSALGISVPDDFVSRIIGSRFVGSLSLIGFHGKWDRMTKAQKIAMNAVDNRASKIKLLLSK